MIDSFLLLAPLLLLPIVLLPVFIGCDYDPPRAPLVPVVPILDAVAGDGMVNLDWPADAAAEEFRVKRGEATGVHEEIATVLAPESSYTDLDVINGTTYFYVVTAVGGGGETPPSNEEVATPNNGLLTSFITNTVLGSTVSATGSFGMTIQVGPNPLIIKTLGRAVAPGNSQFHVVRIIDAATGSDVTGSAVPINTAGGTAGQFVYGPVSATVTLQPGAAYFIVSEETAGGDLFHNHDTTIETRTVATVIGSARTGAPGVFADRAGQIAYGPVDFQF
jgi:hypothetical protein